MKPKQKNQLATFQQAGQAACMFLQSRYHFLNSDFTVCISGIKDAPLDRLFLPHSTPLRGERRLILI